MVDHSDNSDNEELENGLDLFTEPEGYFKPDKEPTFETHTLLSGETLQLRLVGQNPLWGHHLWNAGRVVSHYLEKNRDTLVKGRDVLELGAGAGLPALVCAVKGARRVVVTDYPDIELVENLQYNVDHCDLLDKSTTSVQGYLWGRPTEDLCSFLGSKDSRFTLVILSDLLFNHSEHRGLIASVKQTLAKTPEAIAIVFFTPHRPWLYEQDIAFFDLAKEEGFTVEKILEHKMDAPMFEEDRGDVELRRTVYGYTLAWANT
ncbi:putative methyltransferase-domain-containing protein [Peziza echinospora]|nr:putative methyltransferase-domain-containing protein [Peziza echinospora]